MNENTLTAQQQQQVEAQITQATQDNKCSRGAAVRILTGQGK